MSETVLFQTHLLLGYAAWLLCFGAYLWPRLKAIDHVDAQRAIATLHSFRFFGLVFILPGVVGRDLPASFATFAAYGDLATSVLAMLALLVVRKRPLFWLFVAAFNIVGVVDLVMDYAHAIQAGVPAAPGASALTLEKIGLYEIRSPRLSITVAVNPVPKESDLAHANVEEFVAGWLPREASGAPQPAVENERMSLEEQERKQRLWRLLLAAVLVFLVSEGLLGNRLALKRE